MSDKRDVDTLEATVVLVLYGLLAIAMGVLLVCGCILAVHLTVGVLS
ncbi:MAG TPA: hypothetical protein VGM70_08875 [Pseudolysinimonas sp.]|jgi:hypothetical protein